MTGMPHYSKIWIITLERNFYRVIIIIVVVVVGPFHKNCRDSIFVSLSKRKIIVPSTSTAIVYSSWLLEDEGKAISIIFCASNNFPH